MRSEQYLQNFKTLVAAVVFTVAAVLVFDGSANAQRGKGHGKRGGSSPGHQKQMARQQRGGGDHQQKQRGSGQVQRQKQWNGNNRRAQQQQMRTRNVQRRQDRAVQQVARQRQNQQQHVKAQRRQQVQQQRQVNARNVLRQRRMNARQQNVKSKRQQQTNMWNVMRRRQMNARQEQRQQKTDNRSLRRQQQVRQQTYNRSLRRRQQVQQRQWAIRNRTRQLQQQRANWNQARQRPQRRNTRRADNVRNRGRQIYNSPVQIVPGYAWTRRQRGRSNAAANRYQRDLNRAWKAERKAQRRFDRDQRRYARVRNRSYNYNYFGNYGNTYYLSDYGYERPSWKQHLVQTVIGVFLGGRQDRFYSTYDRFDDRQYAPPAYYSEPVPRYYNSPIYVGYSPGYADEPEYYFSDYGYEANDGFDLGGILGQLPLQDLLANFIGDGFVSELFGNFVVQGYDEGFLAGQAAREYGYDDSYYDNPYVFEGGFCDPYSNSIGDNRELLSEGYAIGYQDALNGRDDYDPYSDGNADLVTALLSGVLGRV